MSAIMRFYEVDLARAGGGMLRFHPGLNEHGKAVFWKGYDWLPMPIVIEGIEYDGQGRLPRPTLTVSNVNGTLGALVRGLGDLNGCLLTHRMTLSDYIPSSNFKDDKGGCGLNGTGEEEFPSETYIFERKAEETREYIKFELASALDLEGQRLPKRSYNANWCSHRLGGPLCRAGAEVASCARTLEACEAIHGTGAALPFGGFPGVGLVGGQ